MEESERRQAFVVEAIKDLHEQTQNRKLGLDLVALTSLFNLEFGESPDDTIDTLIRNGSVLLVSDGMYEVSKSVVHPNCEKGRAFDPSGQSIRSVKAYLFSNMPKRWKDGRFSAQSQRLRILSKMVATQ